MAKDFIKPTVQQFDKYDWEFVDGGTPAPKLRMELEKGHALLGKNDAQAETVFKSLIDQDPYFFDAYNSLCIAYRNQGNTALSLLTAEKAYSIGKECFPETFDFKKHTLKWIVMENRPFLRIVQRYGLECQFHKDHAKAIEIFQENLLLNEGDNQGIRYLLLESLFAMQDYEAARKFISKNKGDHSLDFTFGAVVLDVLEGNIKQADTKLKNAISTNNFFIAEVVKEEHTPPPAHEDPFGFGGVVSGSAQEAFEYWQSNRELYSMKPIVDYFKSKR